MRTHALHGIALLFLAASTLLGCNGDDIFIPRPDSGAPPRDGGELGPLPLLPGMKFSYDAILTYRGQAQGMERNSAYNLTVTIATTDDRGAMGGSALTFTATGAQTLDDDWDPTADFDSWVARMGPSQSADLVQTGAVDVDLEDVPMLPGPMMAPQPKQIPHPGTLFLDLRFIDQIRADFAATYQDLQPQTVTPDMNAGLWLFSYQGPDASIFYYPESAKTRSIRLEYDDRGFLVRMTETIGDAGSPPAASCRINLRAGP